jgi:hypothetical protein
LNIKIVTMTAKSGVNIGRRLTRNKNANPETSPIIQTASIERDSEV